jgi:hypothetical protein
VSTEKVVAYFSRVLKEKENLVDKLNLKYSALKKKQKQLTQYESQSREAGFYFCIYLLFTPVLYFFRLGESLEQIDYDQLKIENQLFQEKINQRNRELLTFKLTAVSTQQTLNDKKVC